MSSCKSVAMAAALGGVAFVVPGAPVAPSPSTSDRASGASRAAMATCTAAALVVAGSRARRVARKYTNFQRVEYAEYEFTNEVGYLPDGTPINAAGNALNHPETMSPDLHTPGSPLPSSAYQADVGYFVDGTALNAAGNALNAAPRQTPAVAYDSPNSPAAFAGASSPGGTVRHPIGFAYSLQKDAYADLDYFNDVGYLPDGTPLNRAGNAINHPEQIQSDPHAPGSPLPRAIFVNDVGYLPDGTPMNQAGNAINHPENLQPDPHSPGSALPTSAYSADVGYLVDGTPLNRAGNRCVQGA